MSLRPLSPSPSSCIPSIPLRCFSPSVPSFDLNHDEFAPTAPLFDTVSDQIVQQKLYSRNVSQRSRDGDPVRHSGAAGSKGISEPNHISSNFPLSRSMYPSLLRSCGGNKSIVEGTKIYDNMVRNGHDSDQFLSNLVLQMFCECGLMREARKVFGMQRKHDLFSWNFMIKACSRYGLGKESLQLFHRMHREAMLPDMFIFATLISACSSNMALIEGKKLHARVILDHSEFEYVLGTALINLYGKCGFPIDAQNAFDRMHKRDVVAWTAIIDAYLHMGDIKEALERYVAMHRDGIMPDLFIITSILEACANQVKDKEGKEMHSLIRGSLFEKDAIVGNALINMYGKCKNVDDALEVFVNIPLKDFVSWNAMIVAYAENGFVNHALDLFDEMRLKEIKPDKTTYVSIFSICATFGAIERGRKIHLAISDFILDLDNLVSASIIDMYGQCGLLADTIDLFQKLPKHHVSFWNALLAAHGHIGNGIDSISIFQELQAAGISPNKDTYISLLSACGKARLIDEGYGYFESMVRDYGISPAIEHYNCMIYMLGRAKKLSDAVNLIGKMPIEPNIATWLTLLAACRNHVDIKRGERVAKHLFRLVPQNPTPYQMLCQLYLADNRDADALNIQKLMRDNEAIQETLDCSSIEVNSLIHTFLANDQTHPQKDEVYLKLASLNKMMAQEGIENGGDKVPDALDSGYHSENIAVAFGMISTSSKTRIFVTKNSRICLQSHTQIKFISQKFDREIVLRDAVCLHLMKGGVCSCGDYW